MKYEDIFQQPELAAKSAVDSMWFILMVHAFVRSKRKLSPAQCFGQVDRQRMDGRRVKLERMHDDVMCSLSRSAVKDLLFTKWATVMAKLTGEPLDSVTTGSGTLSSSWLGSKQHRSKERKHRYEAREIVVFTTSVAELLRVAAVVDKEATVAETAETYDIPESWRQEA